MTRRYRFATFVLLCCLVSPAVAQDCDEPLPSEMMEIQGKLMALMGPGPEHELLEGMTGDWEASVKMWMMPGADPVESPMTSSGEMILGGRFLEIVAEGSMMGTPVESVSIFGYDRRHQHYTMVSFDTMGTYYITSAGIYDDAAKSITFRGTDEDPITGITQDYTFVLTLHEDGSNTTSLTFNCPTFGTGAPYKLLEYTSKRVDKGK